MAEPPKLAKLQPRMDYGMRTAQRYITTFDEEGNSIFTPHEELVYCDRGSYAVSWNYCTAEFPPILQNNKDLDGFLSDNPESQTSRIYTGTRIVGENGLTFGTTNLAPGTETVMHRTLSLDFVTVTEGELELELDSGKKVLLKVGDTVVQRQTNHLWRNPSKTNPARMISVIAPAPAVTINGKTMEPEGFSMNAMGKKNPQ